MYENSTKTFAATEESSFPCLCQVNQTVNCQSGWEFAAGGQKEEGMKILLIWNKLLSPEIIQELLEHETTAF